MPEISQDNFESLNPSEPPATPQELRARANSASGADRPQSTMTQSGVTNANVNNNNRISRSVPSTTAEEIAQTQSSTQQLRLMSESAAEECDSPTNTFVGFQNDYIYGYKRKMTHR